jgi:hypothetical protein
MLPDHQRGEFGGFGGILDRSHMALYRSSKLN